MSDQGLPKNSPAHVRLVKPADSTNSWEEGSVRFSNNRDRTYRSIVDTLWESVEDLLRVQPSLQPSHIRVPGIKRRLPYRKAAEQIISRYGPKQLLSDLLSSLDGSGAIDTPDVDPAAYQHEANYYGILYDAYVQSWREGQGSGAIQMAVPRNWDLLDFCACLARHFQGYRIIRIKCSCLMELYGTRLNHGKGAALTGPLLLWIARFIIETWVSDDTQKTLVSFIASLFGAFKTALETVPTNQKELEELPRALIDGFERLGPCLANVIANSLSDLVRNYDRSSAKVMFIVDLHGPQKSPEQRRMIHCINGLHERLRMHLSSRLLFTHHGDRELEGLLHKSPIINDDEMNGE